MSDFDDLLVEEESVSRKALVTTLRPYIRVGKDSGTLVRQPEMEELSSKQQVAVVLLAQVAKAEMGMEKSSWMAPSEISEAAGIKKGTVYPTVRALDEESIVESSDGEYRVPVYNLERIQRFIQEGA